MKDVQQSCRTACCKTTCCKTTCCKATCCRTIAVGKLPQDNCQVSQTFVGCMTSKQRAKRMSRTDLLRQWHVLPKWIDVAAQTYYLTQSQHFNAGPTSPSTDPTTLATRAALCGTGRGKLHSILTPGQPVLALTLQRWPLEQHCVSLEGLDVENFTEEGGVRSRSAALLTGTLTTGPPCPPLSPDGPLKWCPAER